MKYDWSEIPDHIMWIATDGDGFVFGYAEKPEQYLMDMWVVSEGSKSKYSHRTQPDPNWKDSLEARP